MGPALLLSLLALADNAEADRGNARSGLVMPGALPMESGTAEVAVGPAVLVSAEDEPLRQLTAWPAAAAGLVWAPSDIVAVESQAVASTNSMLSFVGARALVVDKPGLRLAPWVGGGLIGPAPDTGWDVLTLAGVSLEAGGDRFRFDIAVPPVAVLVLRDPPIVLPGIGFIELGATWFASDAMSMRLGLVSMFPTARWRHLLPQQWLYEVDAAFLGAGLAQARIGRRF